MGGDRCGEPAVTEARNPVLQIAETKRPGDAERCDLAGKAIYAACNELRALGGTAVLDGLLSVYVSLAIQWIGGDATENALRKAQRNVSRTAAAIRAARENSGGSA